MLNRLGKSKPKILSSNRIFFTFQAKDLASLLRKELDKEVSISNLEDNSIFFFGFDKISNRKSADKSIQLLYALQSFNDKEIFNILNQEGQIEIEDKLIDTFIRAIIEIFKREHITTFLLYRNEKFQILLDKLLNDENLKNPQVLLLSFSLSEKVIKRLKDFNYHFDYVSRFRNFIKVFCQYSNSGRYSTFAIIRAISQIILLNVDKENSESLAKVVKNVVIPKLDFELEGSEENLLSDLARVLVEYHFYLSEDEKMKIIEVLFKLVKFRNDFGSGYNLLVNFANLCPDLGYRTLVKFEKMIVETLDKNSSIFNKNYFLIVAGLAKRSERIGVDQNFVDLCFCMIKKMFESEIVILFESQSNLDSLLTLMTGKFFSVSQCEEMKFLLINYAKKTNQLSQLAKFARILFSLRFNNRTSLQSTIFWNEISKIFLDCYSDSRDSENSIFFQSFFNHFVFFPEKIKRMIGDFRIPIYGFTTRILLSYLYNIMFLNFKSKNVNFLMQVTLFPLSTDKIKYVRISSLKFLNVVSFEYFRMFVNHSNRTEIYDKLIKEFLNNKRKLNSSLNNIRLDRFLYKYFFYQSIGVSRVLSDKDVTNVIHSFLLSDQLVSDVSNPEKLEMIARSGYYCLENYPANLIELKSESSQERLLQFLQTVSLHCSIHPKILEALLPEYRKRFLEADFCIESESDSQHEVDLSSLSFLELDSKLIDLSLFKNLKRILLSSAKNDNFELVVQGLLPILSSRSFLNSEYFSLILFRINSLDFESKSSKSIREFLYQISKSLQKNNISISSRIAEQILIACLRYRVEMLDFKIDQENLSPFTKQRLSLLYFLNGLESPFFIEKCEANSERILLQLLKTVFKISKVSNFEKITVEIELSKFCSHAKVLTPPTDEILIESRKIIREMFDRNYKSEAFENLNDFSEVVKLLLDLGANQNSNDSFLDKKSLDDRAESISIINQRFQNELASFDPDIDIDPADIPLVFVNKNKRRVYLPIDYPHRTSPYVQDLISVSLSKKYPGYLLYSIEIGPNGQIYQRESLENSSKAKSFGKFGPEWIFADDFEYREYI